MSGGYDDAVVAAVRSVCEVVGGVVGLVSGEWDDAVVEEVLSVCEVVGGVVV